MNFSEQQVPVLTVETTEELDPGRLIPLLDSDRPLLWMRHGYGLAGIGVALRLEFTGPNRIADAAAAWQKIVEAAQITDPLAITGTGLIAFGSFAFAESSARTSVLIVPSLVVGRTAERSWLTRISLGELAEAAVPPLRPFGAQFHVELTPGAQSAAAYRDVVEAAVGDIRNHRLEKVVLARDLVGQLPAGADTRRVLNELSLGYPDCWTFAVDGFIGSSPETLVTVSGGLVTARVLAGSAGRGTDAASDQVAATELATSTKDLDEHRFAVQSVLASLHPHSPTVTASELPFTLRLPNLWHLGSDVEGTLVDGSTALDLVAALHPTAAVAGTPTATALAYIADAEPFDRGRYAAPVGWIAANGDGEWAVAVRSAQISDDGTVTAYAGAGIVADSVPERELIETRLKFRPIVEAFRQ